MKLFMALFSAALLTVVSTSAEARPHHRRAAAPAQGIIVCDQQGCHGDQIISASPAGRRETRIIVSDDGYEGRVVGGRPAGCPSAYCGCGVSLKVFGKIIPELNLASNWLRKFPHAQPAPGMVAARSHHVFYIESVIDAQTVVAYDPNSGGHRTRIHTVSLRGFTVVNPHASRMASK